MANPNIVNVSDIRGKTAVANVTSEMVAIVTNGSSSNKVIKINALYLSNIAGANTGLANVEIFSDYTYRILTDVEVASKSTLDVISKAIYLEEGTSLRVEANVNDILQAVCSYEEIS
jgi:hypothetical protein